MFFPFSGSKIKKFTQRSRLFVGNMPSDVTDEEFKELFKKYGEISETFVHASKGFGFVRLVGSYVCQQLAFCSRTPTL